MINYPLKIKAIKSHMSDQWCRCKQADGSRKWQHLTELLLPQQVVDLLYMDVTRSGKQAATSSVLSPKTALVAFSVLSKHTYYIKPNLVLVVKFCCITALRIWNSIQLTNFTKRLFPERFFKYLDKSQSSLCSAIRPRRGSVFVTAHEVEQGKQLSVIQALAHSEQQNKTVEW